MAVNPKLSAIDVMRDAPVIPVIVLHDVKDAVPLAKALVAGGIRMLEVTLRTREALECIEIISKEVPGAIAGAGTIRRAADAQASALAGAKFGAAAYNAAHSSVGGIGLIAIGAVFAAPAFVTAGLVTASTTSKAPGARTSLANPSSD